MSLEELLIATELEDQKDYVDKNLEHVKKDQNDRGSINFEELKNHEDPLYRLSKAGASSNTNDYSLANNSDNIAEVIAHQKMHQTV